MRARTLFRLSPAVLALLATPLAASAQSKDLEYREPELEAEGDQRLTVGGGFETAWYEYDNMDLRPLDETSDQAILDSDDRNAFAFTGANLDLLYRIDDDTNFAFSGSHRGLWGNDQLGGTSAYGSLLYVSALYVDWTPSMGSFEPTLRIGRQYYRMGATAGTDDFILADTLDTVRIDLPFGEAFRLELLPVNVVGLSGENDRANFFNYIAQSDTQTFGFRGDHMTRRHGLTAVLTPVDGLEARAYAFYTDIGALGTGSDISYDGKLGNFSDNDWVANVGVQAEWAFGPVTPFIGAHYSMGIDRKELVAKDVDTNGLALSGGVKLDTTDEDSGAGFSGELTYFDAYGPAYSDDGMQYSHGYVGMKGQQTGGLVVDRFMGWHPTSYVGMYGVSDSPHDVDRKSGTRVIHAGAGYALAQGLWFDAGWWFFQDTGITFLDMADVATIDAPYGYSSREFEAEERLGNTLGQEIDLSLGLEVTDHIGFFATGGAFLPGAFYAIEVDEIAGDQLGGQATAWAGTAGMEVGW